MDTLRLHIFLNAFGHVHPYNTHPDFISDPPFPQNLGIKYLIICGGYTDQCVESAVRDACDLGYYVTLVTDACVTVTPERHANSLSAISGYCRQRKTCLLYTSDAADEL